MASQGSDILEIRIKDASYRTYYRMSVRINEKDKMQQMIKDLEHFGIELTRIASRPKRFNIFGEMVEEDKDKPKDRGKDKLIENENIW